MSEYDEGRIWCKKKAGVMTVGLTEKALEEIGKIQGISLPAEGDECMQDEVVGEIEGDKVAFEMIAPIDGTIVAVNELLTDDQEILESDPLDEGWIYKIEMPKDDEEEEDEEEDEE
jgi:glycine cleavage system H protein